MGKQVGKWEETMILIWSILLGLVGAGLGIRLRDRLDDIFEGKGFLITALDNPIRELRKPAKSMFHALYRLPWSVVYATVQLAFWTIDVAATLAVGVATPASYLFLAVSIFAVIRAMAEGITPAWDVLWGFIGFGATHITAFWVGATTSERKRKRQGVKE